MMIKRIEAEFGNVKKKSIISKKHIMETRGK